MQILIAEDNSINQRIFKAFLRNAEYEVKFANNGAEAFELFKHEKFCCILMDLHMPVMDGLETTRQIRKFESENNLEEIPIIAVTASHPAEDKDKCFSAGMNDFVQKPISEEALKTTIKNWINHNN